MCPRGKLRGFKLKNKTEQQANLFVSRLTHVEDTLLTQVFLAGLWTAGLFVALGPVQAAVWFAAILVTVSMAKMQPFKKKIDEEPNGFHGQALSFMTAGIWGIAPFLVWSSAGDQYNVLAVTMIGVGFLLVINRYGSTPRPAVIVAAPYLMLIAWFLYSSPMGPTLILGVVAALAYLGTLGGFLYSGYRSKQAIVKYKIEQDELLADLEAARIEADRANHAKSMFLANMSHELRTPLNGILGLSDVLLGEPMHRSQHSKLKLIKDSGKSLLALLNDILDISKIEAESVTLEPTELNIKIGFQNHFAFWKPFADKKQIELVYQKQKDLPECIRLDMVRLRQCMNNMIANALKFTPEGGRVTVTLTGKEIKGRYGMCITVRDTGIGISDENITKLFQPFSQAEASTTRKYGGTGLGLMITRKLCRLMGGDATVTSVVGEGSVFKITVMADLVNTTARRPVFEDPQVMPARVSAPSATPPLVAQANPVAAVGAVQVNSQAAPIQAAPVPVAPMPVAHDQTGAVQAAGVCEEERFAGMRCLVVEDNDINLEVITLLLEPYKLNIVVARNGQEALDALGTQAFDLVLMDLQMPVMGGLEATRTIRASGQAYAGVPIVAMTANAMPSDKQDCLRSGMNGYVSKPLNRTRLVEAMASATTARMPDAGQQVSAG